MRRLYRKLLTFGSLGLFLATAPLLILYAIGYSYNFNKATAEPVGVILLDSKPRRAEIYVNEKKYSRTPDAVSGLPVGEYSTQVTLDGYRPWQKIVSVSAGRATELRDILLIPKDIPSTDLAENVSSFSLSPDRKLIAVAYANKKMEIIDSSGAQMLPPISFNQQVKSLLWSPGSDSVIARDTSDVYWLVDLSRQNPLRVPISSTVTHMVWDMHVPGRILYTSLDGSLLAYQVRTDAVITIAAEVEYFAPTERLIYTVHTNGNLSAYTTQGQKTTVKLPVFEKKVAGILATPDSNIVYQLEDTSLWIQDGEQSTQISPVSKSSGWSPDGRLLFIQTDDYSLHVYNASAENISIPVSERYLIVRLTDRIVNPQWYAGSRHLIYQVKDELHIIEIDTRDHPIDETIASTNLGFADATVGKDGETIYYLARNDEVIRLKSSSLITSENLSETTADVKVPE